MNEIVEIQNVRGYCDEFGTAWLNVEDVARGLGFTQIAASGNEVVRWERVNGYLRGFKFIPTGGDDVKAGDYIPENVFYRLAMKANNAVAETFQAKIADEILPAIRKTGMYINPQAVISPQYLRQLADALEAKDKQIFALTAQIDMNAPKVNYCDSILQCKELVTTTKIAKDYGFSGRAFNRLLHELGVQFKQGDIWLLYQKYSSLGWTQTKSHIYIDKSGQEHCRVHTYWTQKGRLGLYKLLKDNGYLPLIEQ